MSILSDAVLDGAKKIYKDSGKLTKKDLLDLLDENYVGKYVGKKKVEKLDEKYKALYRDFARSLEKDGIKVDGADIKSTKEDKEKDVKTINSSFSPANMTPEGTNPTKELTGSDMGRISKYNYDELKKFPKPFSDNNLTITQLPDGYHFDFHPDGWDFDTEDIAEGCCVMAGSSYKDNDKIRQLPKIDGASIDVEKSIYWLTGGNSMWRFGDMIEGFSGNWNDAKAELVKEMGSEVMEQFNDAKTLGNLMDSFANDDYVQVMYETLGDNHPEWFDYGDEDSESEPVESSDKSIGDDFEDDYSNLDFDTDHPYEDEFEREDRDNKFFNKYRVGHGMRENKIIKPSDIESIISSDLYEDDMDSTLESYCGGSVPCYYNAFSSANREYHLNNETGIRISDCSEVNNGFSQEELTKIVWNCVKNDGNIGEVRSNYDKYVWIPLRKDDNLYILPSGGW